MHKLIVRSPLSISGSMDFPSLGDAQDFVNKLHALARHPLEYSIERLVNPFCGWVPDAADRMMIEACLFRGDKIGPIKFARMKTGSGLKEAKDWVEQEFGEHYRPQARF